MPELFYTSGEIAGLLDDSWTIEVSQARPRPASTPRTAPRSRSTAPSWWPPDEQPPARHR